MNEPSARLLASPPARLRFSDQVVLITGGGSGIGREMALRFLCYRIGVRPPRQSQDGQVALEQETLERHFREFRDSLRMRPT